jgi:hypothetical protein
MFLLLMALLSLFASLAFSFEGVVDGLGHT